jgi:MoxR-like ATPase
MGDWKIYKKEQEPHEIGELPEIPPWRDFSKSKTDLRGRTFQATDREVEVVNLAIYLRRPILITGPPGSGKSSLAFSVAWTLNLGNVLHWAINSHSTRKEGLYSYDAIARLRDANLEQSRHKDQKGPTPKSIEDIGLYITLGPLGTAFFPAPNNRPRVLLIDEIDKSDIDLPNDLLHVFEEGEFIIPELVRLGDKTKKVAVMPFDGEKEEDKVKIKGGKIRCEQFPLVFMTSNGERDLPPAFLRRCLQLDIKPPDEKQLNSIIKAHLGVEDINSEESGELIKSFIEKRGESGVVATDQLLNAIFMLARNKKIAPNELKNLKEVLFKELGRR